MLRLLLDSKPRIFGIGLVKQLQRGPMLIPLATEVAPLLAVGAVEGDEIKQHSH